MRRDGGNGHRLSVRSERNLFSIGYNVTERRRDASFYDLLASEARLGSYVAIALGQVPQDHWFSLGRLLVPRAGADPGVLERIDVRVPDAAPGHAQLRQYPARAQLQGGGAAADRIRAIARRPVGHFRIGIQPHRRAPELPVPGLRGARPGPEARPGRGPGDRPLRQRDGADGRARGKPAKTCSAWRPKGARAPTASTRAWTTRPRACARTKRGPPSAPSWPTTRE